MESDGSGASIGIFIILLLLDVLFYGFGAAIQALNEKDIENKVKEDDKRAIKLRKLMREPNKYVNTVQLIVTFVNIIMGGFYLQILQKNFYNSSILTTAFLLYVILTFGVLIPKKVAGKYSKGWAFLLINPMYYITILLTPLTFIITLSTNAILRVFGIKSEKEDPDVTEEEIISMVNEGHEQGVIQASEAAMITNILEYTDKEVKDIMTHRKNIVAMSKDTLLKDAIYLMLEEKNSRYPVYEENIDTIIGILHLKDAMRLHAKAAVLEESIGAIEGLIREVKYVPETKNIDDLFKIMQSLKIQIVIVVDEYGQTAGLVAMEDILEEIVGNIMDEYDEDEEYIEETGDDEYIIEGITPLEELEEKLNISFEEEEFETVNGFLINKMDKIPDEDEEFEIQVENYLFKVLSVENKMIQSVQVTKVNSIEEQEEINEVNDER